MSIISLIYHYFIINEPMKNNQYLSQFQKDQYTSYLETQLEKFSTFMLNQRKQNEKSKRIEDILAEHQTQLSQMKDQIQLIEVYQHQNLQNCQHINKKISKLEQLDQSMFYALEDRCRQSQSKQPTNILQQDKLQKEVQLRMSKLQKTDSELSKRIKIIQGQIAQNRDLIVGICKSKAIIQPQLNDSYANYKDLKKMQKKMYQYFDDKFLQIERIFKKSERKRSKSPSFKTPIDCISSYISSAQPTHKILSQFKINDNSVKSQISTLSRQTKNTPKESSIAIKKQKRLKSKSKSKSKSKKNLKKQKQNRNSSIQKSSISKSKSPKHMYIQKISKNYLKDKQITNCKSRRSSLSCDKHEGKRKSIGKKSKRCPQSCGSNCI